MKPFRSAVDVLAVGCVVSVLAAVFFSKVALDDQRRILDARNLWESASITDYQYTITIACFCGPPAWRPVRVEVRESLAVTVRYADDRAPLERKEVARIPLGVPALFDRVEALESGKPDRMSVQFDDTLGFPKSVSVDRSTNYVDDEYGFLVEDFVIIDNAI